MYDCIVKDHCFKSPLWINTDPSRWCTDSWPVGKAYQSTVGTNNSAVNTDASGLLSIIINNLTFASRLGHPIDPTDIQNNLYYKAREARNDILHSPKMKVGDAALLAYIDMFMDVLKDIPGLLNNEKPKKAYDSLQELKSVHVHISLEDESRLLELTKNALIAVTEIENEKCEALSAIKAATDQAKADIVQSHVDVNTLSDQRMQEHSASLDDLKISIHELDARLHDIEKQIKQKCENKEENMPFEVDVSGYEKLKQELREDLIALNRKRHNTLAISPLFENAEAPLLEFYVFPTMKYIDVRGTLPGAYRLEEQNRVSSLKEIFHTHSRKKAVNEVYVIADAGIGKTAFCKLLAVTWCFAFDPTEQEEGYFTTNENVKTMRDFDFLFLVSLRNMTDNDIHIDEMIEKQIVSYLARNNLYTRSFMQRVLTEEKCLVILDGLDEWASPNSKDRNIPERKPRTKCTVLTTTGTWKFSMLQLGINDIDKKIILTGLGDNSSKELAKKVLLKLSAPQRDLSREYKEFKEQIKIHTIEELAKIPLIMMFLICLWEEKKSLGETRTQIYSSLFDVFISRVEQRQAGASFLQANVANDSENISDYLPTIYKGNAYCKKYNIYIESFARLAAETLFCESKQNALVFDEQVYLKHLSKDCLMFGLASGILTKIEFPGNLLREPLPKYSFLHKTFQEFLAALDLSSSHIFPKAFDSLGSILEMSNVFVFLSGLSENVIVSNVSDKMRIVVSNDPVTKFYRQEAYSSNFLRHYRKIMKKHQDMYISCFEELRGEDPKSDCLYMEDFILNKSYVEQRCRLPLQTLLSGNVDSIKSLTIDNMKSMGQVTDIIDSFGLDRIHSLVRLDYWGMAENGNFSKLMSSSEKTLKCLTLHFVDEEENGQYNSLSSSSLLNIPSMRQLESLSLWYVSLSHGQLSELLIFISQQTNMTYIGLEDVRCSDHICDGFSFNLTKHEQLEVLNIGHIPLREVHLNLSSLKECRIIEFPFRGVFESILVHLPEAKNLHTFVCHYLTDTDEVNEAVRVLSDLPNLKMIRFYAMNMESVECILPPCLRKIELLQLFGVTLLKSSLESIVEVTSDTNVSVEVQLHRCSVLPSEDEFEEIKQIIKKSERFEILSNNIDAFEFKTLPCSPCK